MNAVINLGAATDNVQVEEARNAFSLYPAIAGAKIELRLAASRTQPDDNTNFQVDAVLQFGRNSTSRFLVTTLSAAGAYTFGERPREIMLTGFVSNEQLRSAEELRAESDLWIILTLKLSTVALAVGGMRTLTPADLTFPLRPGEWASEVARVEAGGYVELLVPTPKDTAYAQMVQRIREARELLRNAKIDASLGAARKALEPLRKDLLDRGVVAAARQAPVKERGLEQRFALMVDDTFAALCGALHDDEYTQDFVYLRADAAALIATTAGLIHRYAVPR